MFQQLTKFQFMHTYVAVTVTLHVSLMVSAQNL